MTSKLSLSLTTGLLITVASGLIADAQSQRAKTRVRSIHVSQLNKVIGYLGHPLGEVITIEGITVDENYTKRKSDSGQLLLRVEDVNGKRLKNEVILHFSPFENVTIRNPSARAKFKYIGYETGGFNGIPERAFDYVPQAGTAGYAFSTSFVVLRDESENREPPNSQLRVRLPVFFLAP